MLASVALLLLGLVGLLARTFDGDGDAMVVTTALDPSKRIAWNEEVIQARLTQLERGQQQGLSGTGFQALWATQEPILTTDLHLWIWSDVLPPSDPELYETHRMGYDEGTHFAIAPITEAKTIFLGSGLNTNALRPMVFWNVGAYPATFDNVYIDDDETFGNAGSSVEGPILNDIVLLPNDWLMLGGWSGPNESAWWMYADGRKSMHSIDNGDSPFQVTQGFERIIRADATGGAITVTLPLIRSMYQYGTVRVLKTDGGGNAITVQPHATDSGASVEGGTLGTQWLSRTYWTDGTNWLVVGS